MMRLLRVKLVKRDSFLTKILSEATNCPIEIVDYKIINQQEAIS